MTPLEQALAAALEPFAHRGENPNAVLHNDDYQAARAAFDLTKVEPAPLSPETLTAMCRAHYEARAQSSLRPPLRWSTWEEACSVPGWLDDQIAAMRAAIEAMGGK